MGSRCEPEIRFLKLQRLVQADKTITQKDIRLVQTNCGASLVAQMVKASAYNVGDPGSIPGSGRSPGEGNGNPLHYSCLENPMG